MLVLLSKEARELLYSSKFIFIFIASFVLMQIAVYNGYSTFSVQAKLVDKGVAASLEDAKSQSTYVDLATRGLNVYRRPGKLSISNTGLNNVVGFKALVTDAGTPQIKEGRYYASPVLSIFGELDVNFIISLIFPLFAILFSYNAVSGEKETGTLRLIASSPVSRSSIAVGKIIGGFLPVMLTFALPFGIGLAGLIFLGGIELSGAELIGVGVISLASILYLLVFFLIGLLVS